MLSVLAVLLYLWFRFERELALGAIVGTSPLPRGEVVSKVWEYIKANNLQDAKDKRRINADAKLKPVFGVDSVTMFEMNKHLAKHLS